MIKVWAGACFLIGILSGCLSIFYWGFVMPLSMFNSDNNATGLGLALTLTLVVLSLVSIFSILSLFVGWRLWRGDED